MYLFQFLADPDGPPPVVFDGVVALNTTVSIGTRMMAQVVPGLSGQWDAMGTAQALYEPWQMTVSGSAMCRQGRVREPASRAMSRLTGQRGWIIAYRYEDCTCETCGVECSCGCAATKRAPVTWYATTGRLTQVETATVVGDGYEYGIAASTPQLVFTIDRPWEYIAGRHWAFGDLAITVNPNIVQYNIGAISDLIIPRHQPCSIGAKGVNFGCWWRIPYAQFRRYGFIEENCVGNWSAGGWMMAYLADRVLNNDGTVRYEKTIEPFHVFAPGDWPPASRLAITNFAYLQVRFKYRGVQHASLSFNQAIAAPQYLYVDTQTGETSIRYCPLSGDPCIDLEGIATFVPEAADAIPAMVTFDTGNAFDLLRPGWNQVEFIGFHLPNSPFAWSYDLSPRWS